VRNALKAKGVASPFKEAVWAESAQAEENTGFASCEVKREIIAAEKRVIPAARRSGKQKWGRTVRMELD